MQQRAGLAMMAWMVLLALPLLTLAQQDLAIDKSGVYAVKDTRKSAKMEQHSKSEQQLVVDEEVANDCNLSIPPSPLHSTPRATTTLPCHARSSRCILEMITWSRMISFEEVETIVTCNGSLCEVTASGYQGRVRLVTSQPHNGSLILTDVRLNDTARYGCEHQWRRGDVIETSTITVDLNVTEQQETNTAAHVPMWYYMPAVVLVVVMAVGLPLLYHFTCKKKSAAVPPYPSTSLDGRIEPRAMQNDAAGEVFYETVNMGDGERRDSMAGEEPHIHGSPLPVIYSTVNKVSSGPSS
ncbi:uncharacterized protein LOC133339719 isoform X2 [Lethenteron reissneri]|uniref:uncharacterized protein LOC133339719 isoform X2 n=1 Tax=Lethenteron reissneri TaxID=7753 RepID=UPI002AB606A1|nr:uncharacterized protein LOC133339719 isoform X2 [Lethenteron reissneri]